MEKRPAYQEVLALRERLETVITHLKDAQRALPMCRHDYNQQDDAAIKDAMQIAEATLQEAGME